MARTIMLPELGLTPPSSAGMDQPWGPGANALYLPNRADTPFALHPSASALLAGIVIS